MVCHGMAKRQKDFYLKVKMQRSKDTILFYSVIWLLAVSLKVNLFQRNNSEQLNIFTRNLNPSSSIVFFA